MREVEQEANLLRREIRQLERLRFLRMTPIGGTSYNIRRT